MRSDAQKILKAIENTANRPITLMEVCGTHTMSIAKAGIKSMLPPNIRLLSGPGCPVCVTTPNVIDAVLELSMKSNVVIATYGDMVRVPGSRPGDNLQLRKAMGAQVEIVYSPVDAVELAKNHPETEIVFLGVGFETTAPGTAAAIRTAAEQNVQNFSVFSMLKTVEPALRSLMQMEDFAVDGFICPGHVGTIIGEAGFRFLPDECGMPAVLAGFEPEDILLAIFLLCRQITGNTPKLQNEYVRAVSANGNERAMEEVREVFQTADAQWRGLGNIPMSGLAIKEKYKVHDAVRKFGITIGEDKTVTACKCGDVITGKISPEQCPMFGKRCVPEDPVGPCMVSSEGACAAAFKYRVI